MFRITVPHVVYSVCDMANQHLLLGYSVISQHAIIV